MNPVLARLARSVSSSSRARKLEHILSFVPPGSTVLCLGVSTQIGVGTQSAIERRLLAERPGWGLTYEATAAGAFAGRLVRADARRLPFADDSFDYVISNAVIEHVGGPAGAQQLVAESTRVARHGWLHTTPNRLFPVEVHTGIPALHWLPTGARESAFAGVGRPFPAESYWLFSPRRLQDLDPRARVITTDPLKPPMTLILERVLP